MLQIGDEDSKDSWVYDFQKTLNDMGYLNTPATGYFGTDTQAAVIQIQTEKGLAVDGKAGPDTRKAVYGDGYFAIDSSRNISNRLAGQTSTTEGSTSTSSSNVADALNPGDKGTDISNLQQRLKAVSYTHLDVYKRQSHISRSSGNFNGVSFPPALHLEIFLHFLRQFNIRPRFRLC